MTFQARLRHGVGVMLKHTLNRLTRRIAKSGRGPFSLVQHVGRRSGKPYETPILVARLADGFVIELSYGPNVDWYKNIQAAGGCTLVWHGDEYVLDTLEALDADSGRAAFPLLARGVLRLLNRRHFVKLSAQG